MFGTRAMLTTPFESVDLYLTGQTSAATGEISRVLQQFQIASESAYPQVWRVLCTRESLRRAAFALREMTPAAMSQVYYHLSPHDCRPRESQLMCSGSASELIDWAEGNWVRELLERNALTTFFQPIVDCHQPHRVFAYECLMRGVDEAGTIIWPDQLLLAARRSGLLERLDSAARLTAIRLASEAQLDSCIFVNFNPRFVNESLDAWQQTMELVVASGIPTHRFVFEVVESDHIQNLSHLQDVLDSCREIGVRVALDDIGTGYNSLQLMSRVRPDFIKLDMELIRDVDKDTYKSCVVAKLIELARELSVYTVVEGVETRNEWEWAATHGADFAQGYLFARPAHAPPRPDVGFLTRKSSTQAVPGPGSASTEAGPAGPGREIVPGSKI